MHAYSASSQCMLCTTKEYGNLLCLACSLTCLLLLVPQPLLLPHPVHNNANSCQVMHPCMHVLHHHMLLPAPEAVAAVLSM